MKSVFVFLTLSLLPSIQAEESSKDLTAISAAIHQFVQQVDQRNLSEVDQVLHADFRAVVNRLFGSDEVSIMDKQLYLQLLKDEKIGGDERSIEIHAVNLQGNNAVVRATFTGKSLIFHTFIQLVKTVEGNWKLISDLPVIVKAS